jgi:hypothetical protein
MASVVPLIPLRRVDDLTERLEAVKADADARGFGTMAYFIETALIEARLQQRQLASDNAGAQADPDALWRPEN